MERQWHDCCRPSIETHNPSHHDPIAAWDGQIQQPPTDINDVVKAQHSTGEITNSMPLELGTLILSNPLYVAILPCRDSVFYHDICSYRGIACNAYESLVL